MVTAFVIPFRLFFVMTDYRDTLQGPHQPGLEPSTQFLRSDELRRGAEFLFLAARTLAAQEEDQLATAGFGPAHGRALFMIHQHEGLSVSELMQLLGITKQSLSRVLENLEAAELIKRSPDAIDGRVRRLYLTPEGKRFEESLFQGASAMLSKAYGAVGQQAVGHLWQTLLYLIDPESRDLLFSDLSKNSPSNSR